MKGHREKHPVQEKMEVVSENTGKVSEKSLYMFNPDTAQA
jgi:hypothetical protein